MKPVFAMNFFRSFHFVTFFWHIVPNCYFINDCRQKDDFKWALDALEDEENIEIERKIDDYCISKRTAIEQEGEEGQTCPGVSDRKRHKGVFDVKSIFFLDLDPVDYGHHHRDD